MALLEKSLHVQGRLRFESGESTPRQAPLRDSPPIALRPPSTSPTAPRPRRLIKLSDFGRAEPGATPTHAAELSLEPLPAVRSPLIEVLGTLLVVASLLFVAAYI